MEPEPTPAPPPAAAVQPKLAVIQEAHFTPNTAGTQQKLKAFSMFLCVFDRRFSRLSISHQRSTGSDRRPASVNPDYETCHVRRGHTSHVCADADADGTRGTSDPSHGGQRRERQPAAGYQNGVAGERRTRGG